MKTINILLSVLLASVASAADVNSFQGVVATLPTCGQTCVNNVLGKASTYGCTATDVTCLCGRTNFKYAIRDCSNSACSTNDASTIESKVNNVCAAIVAASQAGSSVAVVTSAVSSVIGFSSSSSNEPAVVPTTFTSNGMTYTTRLTTNRAPNGSVVPTVVPVASLTTLTSSGSTVIATLVPSTSLTTISSNSMVSTIVTTGILPLVVSTGVSTILMTEASTTVTSLATTVQTVVATPKPALAAATHVPLDVAGYLAVLGALVFF